MRYFLYSAVASAVMLYGLSWFYGVAGSTDLAAIASALSESGAALRPLLLPPLVLMVAGFAAKVALVPFHQWAPDVCEGTTAPVVALFTVAPALVGFAGLTRMLVTILPVGVSELSIDGRTLLITLAVLSMTAGNLVALWQGNVKRFLAYFSVAQAGYLLVGLVAASPRGVTAVLFSLATCVLGDLGALAAVLALSRHTGSYTIESYTGMDRRSPELAWPLLLCLLSLVGIPPTAGFFGRLYLFLAAVEAGLLWLAIVGVVGSVVSLAGVWKIARVLFVAPFVADPARDEERLAVPLVLAIALGVAIVGVFALAVFSDPILTLLQAAARALFG